MKLSELTHNQKVTYRIGTAGPNDVIWGSWKTGEIYLDRRPNDLPFKYRRGHPNDSWKKGAILVLGIEFLEVNQRDWSPEYRNFNVEDYYLEIRGLET